jgi:2-C-methyl-D-erythritol 4-phosphate cytidylyltransferase/2-C-methyl-D-erythritol 2,4-cyclodiphosphate synthase
MDSLFCIVAAAGMGKRARLGYNKNYAAIGGVPILVRNLHQLSRVAGLMKVIVVVAPHEVSEAEALLKQYETEFFPALSYVVTAGGKERQDSVARGLDLIEDETGWVAVHDGARPFAGPEIFERVWNKARETGAAVAAVPSKDTVKVADAECCVECTPDRSKLWAVQTPQIFALPLLRESFAYVRAHQLAVTDDASMVEALGKPVSLVMGDYRNFKITTPDDLRHAESLVKEERDSMLDLHVGSGYDVHCLVPGRPLILCGVTVPYEKGLDGHSDADVALHALMDAILGAAGMGDIGRLFPDNDDAYLGADSRKLLTCVLTLVGEKGWRVHNADVTIIAQRPKLAPFEPQMLANLKADLKLSGDAVNVKATTTEKLGFTGRGEGIAAEAVVTLEKA